MSENERRAWIRLPAGAIRGPFTMAQVETAFKAGRIPAGSSLAPSREGPWNPVQHWFHIAAPPSPRVPSAAMPGAATTPTVSRGTTSESTSPRRMGAGLRITFAVLILLVLVGASYPVYLLYGKLEDRELDEARVVSSPSVEQTQSGAAPMQKASSASESLSDSFQSGSDGTQLTLDERVRFFEEALHTYRDLCAAHRAWIASAEGGSNPCSAAMEEHRSMERILTGFRSFLSDTEDADTRDEPTIDVDLFGRALRLDPTTITHDLSKLHADRFDHGLSGSPVIRMMDGFDWAIKRFGRDETLSRLSKSEYDTRIEADSSCATHQALQLKVSAGAKAVVALEMEMLNGPPALQPLDLSTLSFAQRELFHDVFESFKHGRQEAINCLDHRHLSDPNRLPKPLAMDLQLQASIERLNQLETVAWWFSVPTLRNALDARVAYVAKDPRQWAVSMRRSVDLLDEADTAQIARLRWKNLEGHDFERLEQETPTWLEQTILGVVLVESRKDREWTARVAREAPMEYQAITDLLPLGAASDR